jgi:hypothetical protein
MRSDPSDTGGLFVGRRPGTAPVRFRRLPQRGDVRRQRIDNWFAGLILAAMTFVALLCWGPIPVACLWIASRVNYLSNNVSLGIIAAVAGLFVLLFGALSVMRRLDGVWILVRRAAGHDQRVGMLGRVFATTAVVCGSAFMFWFVILHGPVSSNFVSGGPGGL